MIWSLSVSAEVGRMPNDAVEITDASNDATYLPTRSQQQRIASDIACSVACLDKQRGVLSSHMRIAEYVDPM